MDWTFSDTEPYSDAVLRTNGVVQHFATMERPKFVFADPGNPTKPTHLFNGTRPEPFNSTSMGVNSI